MFLGVLVIVSAFSRGAMETASVLIDVSQKEATPVPRTFLGQFAEHIGCNVYNGQSAQILRNPGFEGWEYFEDEAPRARREYGLPDVDQGRAKGLACYWLPEGDATYALDPTAFNSKYAQRIEIASSAGIKTPLMLPAHRANTYYLSFYARSDRPRKGQVELRRADGSVAALSTLAVEGDAWKRYDTTLTLRSECQRGELFHLAILFENPGTVWLDQMSLLPADHQNGFDPDLVGMLRDLRVSLLRFPGGNFTSGYHWRDGIGPAEKRVSMVNPAWGGIETNQFGTMEWLDFARAIGAEPLICVNCGNGTADEAADWVRFCNDPPHTEMGKLRADNGHPEPYGVRYWEVGNELWGFWQIGHCTPEEYAKRYDAFAKAMRAADPNVLLIANGGDGDWNERFLRTVHEPVRSLSIHRLVGQEVPRNADPTHVFMALAAYGSVFDDELETMRNTAAACGMPDMKFAVTELMSLAYLTNKPPTCSTMAEVAFFAGMMNSCIRNRNIVELITRTAVVNHGGGRAKIREIVFPEPVHYLSQIYGTMSGKYPVMCETKSPRYGVMVHGLPFVKDVPVLETLALVNDEGTELTVLVLNAVPGRSVDAQVRFKNFRPTSTVHQQRIHAAPVEFNTWGEPERVALQSSELPMPQDNVFHFPGCSFTALTFRQQ